MKYLISVCLLIALAACHPDTDPVTPQKPYTFEAWILNDTLHVNYQSDLLGYDICLSKDSLNTPGNGRHCYGSVGSTSTLDPIYNVIATPDFWHPTYIFLETSKWKDTLVIN